MNSKLIEILKRNPPTSAVELIRTVQLYVKGDDIMSVIENIAAGADGISGTDDDIIPRDILETLRVLLKHRVVHELVNESVKQCGCILQ